MFKKVVFLAFCRDIYRALIAALVCFFVLFSHAWGITDGAEITLVNPCGTPASTVLYASPGDRSDTGVYRTHSVIAPAFRNLMSPLPNATNPVTVASDTCFAGYTYNSSPNSYLSDYQSNGCNWDVDYFPQPAINSYGELLETGNQVAIGYTNSSYYDWFAAYLDPRGTIKLDSSDADVGGHGTEFLYYATSGALEGLTAYAIENNNYHPVSPELSASGTAINIPSRTGYVFTGYYSAPTGGTRYIDASGRVTSAGFAALPNMRWPNSGVNACNVWYARWCSGDNQTINPDGTCQQTCPEGESLNVLYDLNLFNPEGTLSGFGFDADGTAFGEGHHDYLNETPNTFGVLNIDQDEILLGSAMCSKDDEGFSPASSLNVDSQNPEENKFCWCSLTGGVQKDAQYSLSPSTWVYLTDELGPDCEKYCAEYCAGLGYSGDYLDFIRQLLNQEYCTPQQYKVSYYCDKQNWLDGEEPLSADTVTYGSSGYSFYGGENMTLAEPCAPAGYHVDGFKCLTATNEDPVDDSVANPWTINDDVVCFASYAPNDYTITLNKVNGSGGANNVYTIYNTNVYKDSNRNVPMTYPGQNGHNSASNIGVPTKSGFVFDGYWSATGNNGVQYIDENGYITQNGLNAGKIVTNNNTIWYAHWLPTYDIHYSSQTVNGNIGYLTAPGALIYGRSWSLLSYDHNDPNFAGWLDPNGSVFDKWCTNADGTGTCYNPGVQSGNWNQQSDLTVYAIYVCDTANGYESVNGECVQQTNTYTVTYSCGSHGSGSPTDSNSPYVSGATVTTLAASVCTADTGYTFGGWACDNNVGTVLAGTTFTMPSANVSCTAQWTPKKYNVIYNPGAHGTGGITITDGIEYDGTYTVLSATGVSVSAVSNAYVFTGWNDGTADRSVGYIYNPYTVDGPLTLTAQWDCAPGYGWNNAHTQCLKTYDVEYHACASQYLDNNDTAGLLTNTLSRPNPQYIELYGSTGLKSIKTGYHFDTWLDANNTSYMFGWYQYDSNQNYYQINLDDNTSPLRLYAQCSANRTNVNYYCGENLIHSDYATYDQSYTFYNNATACGPCVTVTSWNCSYIEKTGTIPPNRPYNGSHNVGQTVTWNDPTNDYGTEYGYVCVAVTQNNSYQITYSGGTATNPNNPNSATHTVTTVAMSPQNVHYGDQNVTLNANTYSQEGYNFDGWSCTGTLCGQQTSDTFTFDDEENIGGYKFGTNLACTAQWTPKKYNVIYNPGVHGTGGTTITDGIEYDGTYTVLSTTGASVSAVSNAYVFVGWDDGTANRNVGYIYNPYTVDGPLTLTAQWDCASGYHWNNDNTECVAYTLSYAPGDSNNEASGGIPATGSMNSSQQVGNSSVILVPNGFTAPDGYHFNGWICKKDGLNSNNGVTVTESSGTYSITMPNNDVTCTAQWAPNEIGLNWLLNSGNWMIDSNGNELSNQNSCDYGTLNGITVYDPVRRGFGFIGWEVEGVSGQ